MSFIFSFRFRYLKDSVSQTSLWIYLLITERFTAHRVEAPIISRMYQELSNGMLGFHNAVKIKTTPFPFPFAQIISISMFVLTVTLPIVINQYVEQKNDGQKIDEQFFFFQKIDEHFF